MLLRQSPGISLTYTNPTAQEVDLPHHRVAQKMISPTGKLTFVVDGAGRIDRDFLTSYPSRLPEDTGILSA